MPEVNFSSFKGYFKQWDPHTKRFIILWLTWARIPLSLSSALAHSLVFQFPLEVDSKLGQRKPIGSKLSNTYDSKQTIDIVL